MPQAYNTNAAMIVAKIADNVPAATMEAAPVAAGPDAGEVFVLPPAAVVAPPAMVVCIVPVVNVAFFVFVPDIELLAVIDIEELPPAEAVELMTPVAYVVLVQGL